MTDIANSQQKIEFTAEMETVIRDVIDKTFETEQQNKINVSVLICDDTEIKRLNHEFRNMDKPTDVLSFPMYDSDDVLDEEELGDIVISLERAAKQAEEYGHSLRRELGFLTAHSMLHLLGYDHIDEDERNEMFERQEHILEQLGITREDGTTNV